MRKPIDLDSCSSIMNEYDSLKRIIRLENPESKNTKKQKSGKKYQTYQDKLANNNVDGFTNRDFMWFFVDTAKKSGTHFVVANQTVAMRQFKLLQERGYTKQQIINMVEFVFLSDQDYLDKSRVSPNTLVSGWCNRIFADSELWVAGEYSPDSVKNSKTTKFKKEREWKRKDDEEDVNIGEW